MRTRDLAGCWVLMMAAGFGSGCFLDLGAGGGGASSTASSGGGAGGSGGAPPGEAPATCGQLGGAHADPKFPGIDESTFAVAQPVVGCAKGFDAASARFTLEVHGATSLSFEDGQLFANGARCTDAEGAEVVLDATTSIRVLGGDADDAVLLDLSRGLGQALIASKTSGLSLELGGGVDRLYVRGSDGPDVLVASDAGGPLLLDVDGDGDNEVAVDAAELLVVSLGDGADAFDASSDGLAPVTAPVVVCAGGGDDVLRGGASRDRLEGGAGDDRMSAAATTDGADVLDGGDGVDTADYAERSAPLDVRLDGLANDGEAGEFDDVRAERVVGGAAADSLTGSEGRDVLQGGPGDDHIDGLGGDDVSDGGPGDDVIAAGKASDGADVVNGGDGMDSIDYAERPAGIVVSLCVAPATVGCDASCPCSADDGEPGESDNLVNVEAVFGTSFADEMNGDASSNQLFGNGGDDVLRGNAGDDSLFGDVGADQLDGGDGDDYLDGGDGLDTFSGGEGQGDICVVVADELAPQCELY